MKADSSRTDWYFAQLPMRARAPYLPFLRLLILMVTIATPAFAQHAGNLRGYVFDPTGAVIPGAALQLSQGSKALHTRSAADGHYTFSAVPPGLYELEVEAQGFAPFSRKDVAITSGKITKLNISLAIAVQHQKITVKSHDQELSISPDTNASAMIFSGSALDAFSDNPEQLQSELQALAGAAAGPNGGQIYVDGFAGDQIPPKSSIREIRVNQNPFSAEHARLGYGRIEILTKPGSDKFSGEIRTMGTNSAWNTANPIIQEQPKYYFYAFSANIHGPFKKVGSYFLNGSWLNSHNQGIVDAVNPDDTTSTIHLAFPVPSQTVRFNPRFDFQLGKNNTLTIRNSYNRKTETGAGVNTLYLPSQAFEIDNEGNAFQLGNTTIINSRLLNEVHFQWQRIRSSRTPDFFTPTITVMGAFTDGGSNAGVIQDHQDNFTLEDEAIMTAGRHTLHFGARARVYRDANYATTGENGNYLFYSIDQYNAKTPGQYQATVIDHPLVRAVLFDGSLYYQDDWRWKPNFNLSYGLRFEGQNRIRDHANWAPRISIAWAPTHSGNKPRAILRAGYGFFYDRFTVPSSFISNGATPYIVQAIHDNGINQRSYVVDNPDFYNPGAAAPAPDLQESGAAIPYHYTVDPHFRAALNMQGAVGVDFKPARSLTANVTYLYTRGVHQYYTNNISAPAFDPSTYTVTGPLPSAYNYQFQSGGVYRQNQVTAHLSGQFHHLAFNAMDFVNFAKSDTQGVDYFPSVPGDPGLDYGRASFGERNTFLFLGVLNLPYKIRLSPILAVRSGTPYNITIGSDLTANNQTNARPTYGTCGAPGVVSTKFGCLDTDPVGKGERMVPYGLGVGPTNSVMHLVLTKVIGIGPRSTSEHGAPGLHSGGSVGDHGLGGGQQMASISSRVPRKYSLTVMAYAMNALNIVNLGAPNGVLNSSLFGKSQSLAGGQFSMWLPGNRIIVAGATFTF